MRCTSNNCIMKSLSNWLEKFKKKGNKVTAGTLKIKGEKEDEEKKVQLLIWMEACVVNYEILNQFRLENCEWNRWNYLRWETVQLKMMSKRQNSVGFLACMPVQSTPVYAIQTGPREASRIKQRLHKALTDLKVEGILCL